MNRLGVCLVALLSVGLLSCGGVSGSDHIDRVNHVIWIMQEFRSFDNYYGKLNDYRRANGLRANVDGLPDNASNPNFDGDAQIAAFHLDTVCIEQMTPAWDESHTSVNRSNPSQKTGPMDGFAFSAGNFARNQNAAGMGPFEDLEGVRAMGYYTEREIPYYYFMATQFATSDRFFGTILSRTPPNRIANIAASALGIVNAIPDGQTFSQKTIFHLLDEAGISWKIYQTEGTYLGYFEPFFSAHRDHVVPSEEFFTDLKNNTLPQVAYIEPISTSNEHTATNVQLGAARVAELINALMASESWKDSVFFLTYDHGGEYDHVPPRSTVNPDDIRPQLSPENVVDDYSRTGFRVPLIAVSPFAKQGFVSHTEMDNTAILKFIETRFNLPSLTKRDAKQPDMTEFFDFDNPPNLTPPTPPEQPTDAPCTFHTLP